MVASCGKALYIDTENTFRASRNLSDELRTGVTNPKEFLEGILILRAFESSELELAIRSLPSLIPRHRIRVVVIDTIISLLRAEFAVYGTLVDRQQRLNRILHALKNYSDDFGCAVVITNQVRAKLARLESFRRLCHSNWWQHIRAWNDISHLFEEKPWQ